MNTGSEFYDECAFLWSQRSHAVGSLVDGLDALSKLDLRLEAAIEGALLNPDVGRGQCLEMAEADTPGAVCASACLAILKGDSDLYVKMIRAAMRSFDGRQSLTAVLSWLPYSYVDKLLGYECGPPGFPAIQEACLRALCNHRLTQTSLDWETYLSSPGESSILAMHLIGIHRLPNLLPDHRKTIWNEASLGWFAWAETILGRKFDTKILLHAIVAEIIPGDIGIPIVCQVVCQKQLLAWIDKCASEKATLEIALKASGINGTTSDIHRLLVSYADVTRGSLLLKKKWAHAFFRITGFYPLGGVFRNNVCSDLTSIDEELTEMAPIDHLPVPDLDIAVSWWKENQKHFAKSNRYRYGDVLNESLLREQLRNASQADRKIAAYELGMLLQTPVIPTESPIWRQRELINSETNSKYGCCR